MPSSLLRQQITVEPYLGDSATGPRYGPAVALRARVEGKRRVVGAVSAGPDVGSDVISTASATIRPPDFDIPAQSKVTAPSPVTGAPQEYEVLQEIVGQGLSRAADIELLLG